MNNNHNGNHHRARKEILKHLFRNVLLLIFSIVLAAYSAKSGLFEYFLNNTRGIEFLGSFIAGLFFTSVLTIGPATVALAEIAQQHNLLAVVFIGAIGSVIGDLVLFLFVRQNISDDFTALFDQPRFKKINHFFHLAIFRWLTPLIGALLIASPLPDELGLAMMGISKIKPILMIPLTYIMNVVGIFIVGLVARSLI